MKFSGKKLKEFRKASRWSQKGLAIELGKLGTSVVDMTISNWERGKTIPDSNELAKLTMFFNKPIKAFFMEEKNV